MFKKQLPTMLLAVAMCLLFSCKKNVGTDDSLSSDDAVYKEKVEQLLDANFQPTALNKQTGPGTHLRFETYEEAYSFFKFLEEKKAFKSETAVMGTIAPSTNNAGRAMAGTPVYNYNTTVQTSTPVHDTYGTSSIGLTYNISWQIQWALPTGGQAAFVSNSPLNGMLFYSGLGTASGTVQIVPQPPAAGKITGAMQGTVTIAGTTASFFIMIDGSYSLSMPGTPGGISYCVTYLSAKPSQIDPRP